MFTRLTILTSQELKSAIVREPLTVSLDMSVMDAVSKMTNIRSLCNTAKTTDSQLKEFHLDARSSCVLAMENEQVVGILTERDLVRLTTLQQPLKTLRIRDVMTSPVITLRESALRDLFLTINLLGQHHIRHLPILDEEDHLIGLVTHESLRRISQPIDLLRLRLVKEVMSRNVVCAAPDSSILKIAQLMANHRVSSVVIVKTATHLDLSIPVGILTERDLVQFHALGLSMENYTASAVMSFPVFEVTPDESLLTVQQIMEEHFIQRVVVTGKQGELLGIVTQSSILQALNPLELYNLAEVLEEKVVQLEAEKVALLEHRTLNLEQQIEERTKSLRYIAERDEILLELATQVQSSLDLSTILGTTVLEVRELLDCESANVWRFQADEQIMIVAESTNSSSPLLGTVLHDICLQKDLIENYRQENISIVRDSQTANISPCQRQLLVNLGIRAQVLVPILCGEQLWGLLNVSENQNPRDWQPAEVELLRALSLQLAIAVQQAITHQQLQEELKERQQAEKHQQESEQKYATLAAIVPVGIFRTDILGNSYYVNERWSQITGLPLEKSMGDGWQQVLYPEDRERVISEWQEAICENRPISLEFRFQHLNGQVNWVYGQAIAELDEEGKIVGYVGTLTDINDRKQAEAERLEATNALKRLNNELEERITERTKELQKREAQLQDFLNNASDLIQITNMEDGHFEYVNRAWLENLGYSEAEVKTLTIFDVLHPDCYSVRSEVLAQMRSGNTSTVESVEVIFLTKTGQELIVEGNLNCQIENGSPVAVRAIFRNITERRAAEKLLQEQEAHYRALMDRASDAIILANQQGHLLEANRAAETLLGYSQAEIVSMHFTQLHLPEELPRIAKAFEDLANQKVTQVLDFNFLCKDGHIVPVDVTASVIEIQDQKIVQGIFRDITERKQTELEVKKLLQELSAFKLGVDQSAIVAITDHKGVITYANENFCKISGYSCDEIIGQTHRLVNSGYHPTSFFKEMWNTIGSGKVWRGEICNRAKNGYIYWVESTIAPFLNEEGRPVQYLAIRFDITARKEAEISLQAKTEELDQFFSVALDLLCIADNEGHFRRLNRQWERTLGYSLKELEGAKFLQYVHPEDINNTIEAINQLKNQQEIINFINRYRCQDGSYRWLEWRSVPIDEFTYAAARDITNNKEAEIALKRQLATIEAAIDGIGILQGDTYLYLNQAHLNLFGYEHLEELVGKSWRVLYSPEELERFEREIFPKLRLEKAWQGEAIATRKNGSTFVEGLSLTLTEDGSLICICRDITEQKQAKLQLEQTNKELARATRLKDEFLASMSHELRTPLNAILGMTEGLQEQFLGEVNEKQLHALQIIEKSGTHLLSLINDILDVAKIESGKLELEFAPVDVKTLCESSLVFVKQQALQKRIQLEIKLPPNLPKLLVDERHIRQALINLLNNAVKFTPEEGRITMEVTKVYPEQKEGGTPQGLPLLRISITDTGIGIAPENLSKLFQPFIQVDSALNRQYKGTGLGLALVKSIVNLHGGQVGLTSQVGRGSCFTIDLPCSLDTPPSSSPREISQTDFSDRRSVLHAASCPIQEKPSPLILLAEDNEINISTTASYLRAKGYRLLFAKNGQEAITISQSEKPDLILMDIKMPVVDGLEAMKQIRLDPNSVYIPIIALTALAMPGDRERCLAAGANEFITKPVKMRLLVDSIRQLLTH